MAVIADRLAIKVIALPFRLAASRFIKVGLLLCLAFVSQIFGQNKIEKSAEYNQILREYDNGNYSRAVELANIAAQNARKTGNKGLVYKLLDVAASAQIASQKYAEAEQTLNETLRMLPEDAIGSEDKAQIYLRFAWLHRSQRNFSEAIKFSQKAVAYATQNRRIKAENYLNVGRTMFSSGFDITATIWLEKAEKTFAAEPLSTSKLETYRFLTLAWASKMNYAAALHYADKWIAAAENTRFKLEHRKALFETATLLSGSGQKQRAFQALEKGLKLSFENNDAHLGGQFLISLLLHSLYEENADAAADYLRQLEKTDAEKRFAFEALLGKAVIAAYQNQQQLSEKLFIELEQQQIPSEFLLLFWKTAVAQRNGNWREVLFVNEKLLKLATDQNFREDLPLIYLNLAKAHFRVGQIPASLENLEKSLACIEEIRRSENNNLTLGLFETYHNAYRLLAQIKSGDVQESFELSDFLKARLLKDRINNSILKPQPAVSPDVRAKLEALSVRFVDDPNVAAEIEKTEKLVTNRIPALNLVKPDLSELNKVTELDNAAIVSYFFTLDEKLLASVWEKNKPVQAIQLPISQREIEVYAKTTDQKIKDFIFFKQDGKEIYDKLLKPLNLSAKQLIIVPDGMLWKIPFQALSADGERYLIEEKTVSYAPSVSILLEQLKNPKPQRQTLQAFANSSFDNRILRYANAEATEVAEIYGSTPFLNAKIADFARVSDKADISHFSMHAEIDASRPLESFLGFKKVGADDGRLTVEELLSVRLKRGSLVFLASCETNNVLNGEGVVSLAWATIGSGATTVISSQWEANDRSTQVFAKTFYGYYKAGDSAAEAIQKVSSKLIQEKSNGLHQPYYWANFSLSGDFR